MSKRSLNDSDCNFPHTKMSKNSEPVVYFEKESESVTKVIDENSKNMSQKKFTILPSPIKSENDTREYRVIKLENGLTALLISDMHNADSESLKFEDGNSEYFSEDDDDDDDDDEDEDEDGEDDDGEDDSRSSHRSGEEEGSEDSCVETVSNGEENEAEPLKQKEKLAAVGLCIGVGSYSDPDDIPGLAHFLEHMVFMGSAKYPTENSFDEFLKLRGGGSNGVTDTETTTFCFDCHERHLRTVLDRFSQFFISPLLRKESMKREREAVHSEFKQSLPKDDVRKESLICSLAKDGHPARKFSWGNMKTLRDDVDDDKLYETLKEFLKRHYSAHRTTVAIQARLPLSTLEELITESFMHMPCNNLPPIDFSQYTNSFDNHQFHKKYTVLPVNETFTLDLTWAFPSLVSKYRSKPQYYLSWVMGHEGRGSLLSLLRERFWATAIYCGNDDTGAVHNSMFTLFTINIILTSTGYDNIEKVLNATFGYINMLKKNGPSFRIFEELKAIEDIHFRFVSEVCAFDYVEHLAEAMQFFSPEDYLTGTDLLFEFDPETIGDCLNLMIPENVNVLIVTPDSSIVFNKEDPWFTTQYRCDDIPEEWIENWRTQEPHKSLFLPQPNLFIPTDFDRVKTVTPVPEVPIIIRKDEYAEVWYRPDDKFTKPETFIHCSMTSPTAAESACNLVMLEIFAEIFSRHMGEDLYPAQMTGLKTEFIAKPRGISVKICGFSHKLHLLVEFIAKNIATYDNMLNDSICDAMLEEMKRLYYNEYVKPTSIHRDIRFSVLLCNHWTYLERFIATKEISLLKIKSFLSELLSSLYLQILVQGNYTEEQVHKVSDVLISSLPRKAPSPGGVLRARVRKLNVGKYCCLMPAFKDEGNNSVVTNYYQFGPIELKSSCILEVIMMIMQEPLFNILRTKKQLGYDISCDYLDTYGIIGLCVSVYFQSDKFSAEKIDEEIESFLNHEFMGQLKKMKKKNFEKVRQAVIVQKTFVDLQLKDEVQRNWTEILSGDFLFNRWSKEVECLQEIELPDVINWYEHFMRLGENKGMSIQIIGKSSNKNMYIGKSDEEMKIDNLIREQQEREALHAIEQIASYKKNLFVYPEAHLKL